MIVRKLEYLQENLSGYLLYSRELKRVLNKKGKPVKRIGESHLYWFTKRGASKCAEDEAKFNAEAVAVSKLYIAENGDVLDELGDNELVIDANYTCPGCGKNVVYLHTLSNLCDDCDLEATVRCHDSYKEYDWWKPLVRDQFGLRKSQQEAHTAQ